MCDWTRRATFFWPWKPSLASTGGLEHPWLRPPFCPLHHHDMSYFERWDFAIEQKCVFTVSLFPNSLPPNSLRHCNSSGARIKLARTRRTSLESPVINTNSARTHVLIPTRIGKINSIIPGFSDLLRIGELLLRGDVASMVAGRVRTWTVSWFFSMPLIGGTDLSLNNLRVGWLDNLLI